MKIIVIGDLHGDWGSLNNLISRKHPDVILQCGDFGWWPKMEVTKPVLYGRQNTWVLKGIKPHETKVYFCDGNHEQHPELCQDGLIHEMYDNIYHASRGSILTLPDGRNVMFIGGADSVDKNHRILGHDWYPEENISLSQFDFIMNCEDRIDIVVSHTCPASFDIIGSEGKYNDPNRIALENVLEKFQPSLWYFGHWHRSKVGKVNNTYWQSLDYPKHCDRWWCELK